MKKLILTLSLFIFVGCGGGNSNGGLNEELKTSLREVIHSANAIDSAASAKIHGEQPNQDVVDLYNLLQSCDVTNTETYWALSGSSCPIEYWDEADETESHSYMYIKASVFLDLNSTTEVKMDGIQTTTPDNNHSTATISGFVKNAKYGVLYVNADMASDYYEATNFVSMSTSMLLTMNQLSPVTLDIAVNGYLTPDSELNMACKINGATADCLEVMDLLGWEMSDESSSPSPNPNPPTLEKPDPIGNLKSKVFGFRKLK